MISWEKLTLWYKGKLECAENRGKRKKRDLMQEEINSTEATEERLGTKDQDVAVKLWELSVDPAGGR